MKETFLKGNWLKGNYGDVICCDVFMEFIKTKKRNLDSLGDTPLYGLAYRLILTDTDITKIDLSQPIYHPIRGHGLVTLHMYWCCRYAQAHIDQYRYANSASLFDFKFSTHHPLRIFHSYFNVPLLRFQVQKGVSNL